MRKPAVDDRKMVNNRVKFISKIVETTPNVKRYLMTDAPGQENGFWSSIHELRDEEFEDYLFNRPGYFGHQTKRKALMFLLGIFSPAILGWFMGLIFGLVGVLVSGVLVGLFLMLHYRRFLECCKNSEGPSVT